MKKHFSLFLAVLFLFTAGIPMTGVYADTWEGAGTAESPYLIKTAADLLALNGQTESTTVYQLENDIILDANAFVTSFGGKLKGNGKTVTLNITSGSNVGLFGELKWGTVIQNLTVAGTVNGTTAAGIAGSAGNETQYINCVNKAKITGSIAGGIVGAATGKSKITLTGCRNEGTIAATSHVGGMVGNLNNTSGTISLCSNAGSISSSGWGATGGIVGYANKNTLIIQSSYNTGAVSQSSNYPTAGISSGNMSSGGAKVENCFNAGNITSNGSQIAAIAYGTDAVTNSYNAYPGLSLYGSAATASGNYNRNDGTTAKQNGVTLVSYQQMLDKTNFEGFDFTNTWIEGTEAYPFPQLKNNALTGTVTLPDPPAAPDFETGTGSKADPYIIKTADEFKNMAKEIYNNASSETLKYFKLGADIVLNDYTPFVFAGHLDGDNHVVTVNINLPELDGVGLFRSIKTWGSGISNLVIDGTIIGKNYVGGLIGTTGQELGGQISSGTTIENITNRASVTAKGEQAGGIFGRDYGGSTAAIVRNLRNEGTVTAGVANAGGIAGVTNHALTGCSNTGSVTANTYGVGGIVGWGTVGQDTTFENCYNTGDIKGSGSVGGIIGTAQYNNKTLTVQNCYNTGTIQSTNAAEIGGIVAAGTSATTLVVKNCYNLGSVRKESVFHPIVAETSAATVTDCYYLSPCGEAAKYGTAKTTAELQAGAALLGSAFTAGSGAYLYPQLTANTNSQASPVFHVLTITAGEHGTVVPGCAVYVADGKTQTVSFEADEDYTLGTVTYNSVEQPGVTDSFTTPEMKADASLAVTFVPATVPETVTPFATPFYSAGEKFGIVFAAVTALPTEYGMLISKTAQTAESLVDGAEGVIKCAAVTPASANGQYGIKFDKLEAGTYYTRAYAAYAGGMVYGASIVEIVIE